MKLIMKEEDEEVFFIISVKNFFSLCNELKCESIFQMWVALDSQTSLFIEREREK